MARLLVVQHEPDAPVAWLGEWWTELGLELDVVRGDLGEPVASSWAAGHDGLVVLGGAMGACDDARRRVARPDPCPHRGCRRPRGARARGLPRSPARRGGPRRLGGAQPLRPHHRPGSGAADRCRGIRPVAWAVSTGCAAIHYNDDVVTVVPAGATVLATLPDGRPQAIRFGPQAWGVQFHPETSPEVFGAWLRWDSPDGLTPEQEVLLGQVQAARETPAGGVAALRGEVRGAGRGGCRGATCVSRHLLSGPLPHRRSIASGGSRTPAVDPAATENAMSASASAQSRERVVILGAAGRDFHDFNLMYRDDPGVEVVAFTATQIPDIAGRAYPRELAGPLYPHGIPIVDEDELESLVAREHVDTVVLAYSDLSHAQVMHLGSRVIASGADFVVPGTRRTTLRSRRPVVAVTAVRTGVGKSQTTRYVARLLRDMGLRVVAVRHPMPYGDLAAQACQRFETPEDLVRHECTIEEREEYEPHIEAGVVVYAGVDYAQILARAEAEADVVLWDGGNNDLPFYAPDLHLVARRPAAPRRRGRLPPG